MRLGFLLLGWVCLAGLVGCQYRLTIDGDVCPSSSDCNTPAPCTPLSCEIQEHNSSKVEPSTSSEILADTNVFDTSSREQQGAKAQEKPDRVGREEGYEPTMLDGGSENTLESNDVPDYQLPETRTPADTLFHPDASWMRPRLCQNGWRVERHLSVPTAGLQVGSSHGEKMMARAVGPRGGVLAFSTYNGSVELRDTHFHKRLLVLPSIHSKLRVHELAFGPNEASLFVLYSNGMIVLYELPSGNILRFMEPTLGGQQTGQTCSSQSSCPGNDEVCLKKSCIRYPASFFLERRLRLALRSDNLMAATCDSTGGIRVWNTSSVTPKMFRVSQLQACNAIRFRPGHKDLWVLDGEKVHQLDVLKETILQSLGSGGLAKTSKQCSYSGYCGVGYACFSGVCASVNPQKGHAGSIHSFAFSPSGDRLVTAGEDRTLRLWQIGSGKQLKIFGQPQKQATTKPCSSNRDCQHFEQCQNYVCYREFLRTGHTNEIAKVVFRPDGKRLLAFDNDRFLLEWDLSTFKVTRALEFSDWQEMYAMHYTPSLSHLYLTLGHLSLLLLDLNTNQLLWGTSGHLDSVVHVRLSPNQRFAFSGTHYDKFFSARGSFHVHALHGWSLEHGWRMMAGIYGSFSYIYLGNNFNVAMHPTLPVVAASWDYRGLHHSNSVVYQLDLNHGNVNREIATPSAYTMRIESTSCVQWHPKGTHLVVSFERTGLTYFQRSPFKQLWPPKTSQSPSYPNYRNDCLVAAFHPNEKELVTVETKYVGSDLHTFVVSRSLSDGKVLKSLLLAKTVLKVTHLLVHPSRDEIVLAFEDGSIQLWNRSNPTLLRKWKAHKGSLLRLWFRKKGKELLSLGEDQALLRWDPTTGMKSQSVALPSVPFTAADISPDETTLLTGHDNGAVVLWKACP
ncbi:MAG: WD40 repeat domain-containing protein [Deltaproteobacteria bacterium]|nr:MAG: WD40 repeat domain-containing protein [Deltaproteobacteria bacterium]